MSATRKLSRHEAAEFIEGLRRDISAARLRVTLDGKLGRATPPAVKKLASLPEPPVINDAVRGHENPARQSDAVALSAGLLARTQEDSFAAARTVLRSGLVNGLPGRFILVQEEMLPQDLPSESEMK